MTELLRQLVDELNHPEALALLGLALTGLGLGLIFSTRRRKPQPPPQQAGVPGQTVSKPGLTASAGRR